MDFGRKKEKDVSNISISRTLMESLGELASSFAQFPSMQKLLEILEKVNISEELASFILKCISFELTKSLSLEGSPGLVYLIFQNISTSPKIQELSRKLHSIDSAFGIRLLSFCLQTDNAFYTTLPNKLERDIRVSIIELDAQLLNWLFPSLFTKMPSLITPEVINLFLKLATPELIFRVELDLLQGKYSIFSNQLSEILKKAPEFSHNEQLLLWKLLKFELKTPKITEILENWVPQIQNNWENISGLISYIRIHASQTTSEHVRLLLQLPAKHYRVHMFVCLSQIKPVIVEEAVLNILQQSKFQYKINLLNHMKYWIEKEKSKLSSMIKTNALQEALNNTLQSLSGDYHKEFNALIFKSADST